MGSFKQHRCHRRNDDDNLFDLFVSYDDNASHMHSKTTMFVVMMLTMMISFLPCIIQYGAYGGNKGYELNRERKPFDESADSNLSDGLFRRIYRMRRCSFNKLHSILEPELNRTFFPKGGGTRKPGKSTYLIDTKTRLAIAIRYFSGGDPLDLMRIHNVGHVSVFRSVWGVIDAVNSTDALAYLFPFQAEQKKIAKAFESKSGAGFKNVIGAIDGILICTLMQCAFVCELLQCGAKSFRCHRKDMYGLNMQAICDGTIPLD